MIKKLILIAGGMLMLTAPAFANDGSAYTLFNPVPDDAMRSLATDRPGKSTSPVTVDAGHFQVEADIANWSYDHYNSAGVTQSNLSMLAPIIKAGLTQSADIEIGLTPLSIDHTTDRASGSHSTAFGFGDVYVDLKYNLFGNDGGTYALAIVPYVKAPSGNHMLGNQHWEGGAYAPFTIQFENDWLLSLMTEFDYLKNDADNNMHANYQNIANLSHPVFIDSLSAAIEFWSDVSADRDAPTQYSLDGSLAWVVNNNLQLDAGVNVGLNKATPDVQPYLGISRRF